LAKARFAQRSRQPNVLSKPVFEIDLLGRPCVSYVPSRGNLKPVVWRLRRSFELVAYLALAPERWVAREAVMLALWPDADPLTVERNFHPTISDGRRALSQAAGRRIETVVVDQGGYRLSEAVSWRVDVDRFHRYADTMARLRQTQPPAALIAGRRAWRAYRGHLLAGSRQPWADTARETIERRYHRLLEAVASLAAVGGRLEVAMDAYRTLLVDDPFAEAVHLALM
jgi:two-component SAPR family response regulator